MKKRIIFLISILIPGAILIYLAAAPLLFPQENTAVLPGLSESEDATLPSESSGESLSSNPLAQESSEYPEYSKSSDPSESPDVFQEYDITLMIPVKITSPGSNVTRLEISTIKSSTVCIIWAVVPF